MAEPVVVIAGRPNVGKSTLLNRVLGRREAIVEERPGVTRDRKSVTAEWLGHRFTLVDTGGWLAGSGDHIDAKVSRQSEAALADADVVLFVVDSAVGVTTDDEAVAEVIRRSGAEVLVVANKVDDAAHEARIWDFLSLGMGDPFPVSSLHGRGTGDLLDAVVSRLGDAGAASGDGGGAGEGGAADAPLTEGDDRSSPESVKPGGSAGDGDDLLSIAIVGRPNVGKSTLFNRLVGDERSVVHDMAGTTRDSVDTVVDTRLGRVRFVDTAGLRRKSRVDDDTEYYSTVRALSSVDRADIALLVIDATEGITHQDQRLAERIDGAGCPLAVVINKWELLDADARRDVERQLERKLRFVGDAPVLKISALTGKGVQKLVPALETTVGNYRQRVSTRDLNRAIRAAQAAHPAPDGARVLYAVQGATDPPTFTLFANRVVPRTYLRFLERSIREEFGFGSTPLKLRVRRRDE